MRLATILGLGAVALMALTAEASAQSYPSEQVKIVVPFGAGSVTDTLARVLADKLGPMWKQNVIVENRPGLPGTTSVAKSPADGYTLMVTVERACHRQDHQQERPVRSRSAISSASRAWSRCRSS